MKRLILLAALMIPLGFSFQTTYANAGQTVEAENNRISEKEAEEIALKKVKGEVVKVKLEMDDGREYYEVIIKGSDANYEVEIDAKTGQVLEVEKEGSRDDGNHDGHDDDDNDGDDDRYDD